VLFTIEDFRKTFVDSEDAALRLRNQLTELVNQDTTLKSHRDWIEANHYGLGERCFHYLWKMLVDEMPVFFRFLEIGVHCGQVPSLIGLLAENAGKRCEVYGVSPFTGVGMHDHPVDYESITKFVWSYWCNTDSLRLIRGYSNDPLVVSKVRDCCDQPGFRIVYIDGGHDSDIVRSDLLNYSQFVKVGGYLLTDNSANRFRQPFGFFQGMESVSRAVDELLPPFGSGLPGQWEHLGAIVHLRLFRRLS